MPSVIVGLANFSLVYLSPPDQCPVLLTLDLELVPLYHIVPNK